MSPITKLDTILRLLATDEDIRPYASEIDILDKMYPKHDINKIKPPDITKALERLIDDGYVKTKPLNKENKYYTTFKGELFHVQNGYKGQQQDKTTKVTLQLSQAVILILAAIIASIYYFHELAKTTFPVPLSVLSLILLFCIGSVVGVMLWLLLGYISRLLKGHYRQKRQSQ